MNLCKEISRNKTGSRQSVSSCSWLQSFWKTVHAKAVKLTHLIWLLFVIRHKKTYEWNPCYDDNDSDGDGHDYDDDDDNDDDAEFDVDTSH